MQCSFAVGKFLLLPLMMVAMLLSSARGQEVNSLIDNGDFEQVRDGAPVGWFSKNTPNISLQEEDGNHFLRLTVTEPGKMVLVYRAIQVKPEHKAYELSYRVRYEGIKVGKQIWHDGRIMMNFKDESGKEVKPGPKPPVFKGNSNGWQQKSQKFLVPEGAKTLEFMPCLFEASAGTLDFDDFRLVPVADDSAVDSMKAEIEAAAAKASAEAEKNEQKADEKIKAQLQATGNLIANGDFQTPNKAGNFANGWGSLNPDSGITWEKEGDDYFMRLVQKDPTKIQMLHQFVLLPRGVKGVEVSVRYRTSGVERGSKMPGDARLIMHWLDGPRTGHIEVGKRVPPSPGAISFSAKASEWTEVSRKYLVPEGATKLQLMPGLWFAKAGTVDISEIRITPISDAEAQEMANKIETERQKKAQQESIIAAQLARPAITEEIKVSGNQLVKHDGTPVWLQGLCVDSMEWGHGERILWSIHVAINEWKANAIRLPVHHKLWFGQEHKGTPAGDPTPYRKLVDDAVKLCAVNNAYLILDLHAFGAPMPEHAEFWKDAAARYKDNPAVLFEVFNEPHGIPWSIWRDGGDLRKNTHVDNAVVENTEKNSGDVSIGMQALVDAVRSTGARNIIIAGGLAWSYDLSGVLQGYALKDHDFGNGIMYSHHNYPWKKGWQKAVLDVAEHYPIFVGEVGCPEKWEDFPFIKPDEQYEKLGPGCTWPSDMLGAIQKYKLHWTGFSFHPSCGPMVIKDWDYTPTEYWGVYVKEALAGKQFKLERLR